MQTANISEFRANLASYVKKVNHGESFAITSGGEVMATLTAPINQRAIAQAKLSTLAETAIISDVISPCAAPWDATA
jgi:antitoxin (DNA-binding transcriptional repressor) of toxin-antitoxin stability system